MRRGMAPWEHRSHPRMPLWGPLISPSWRRERLVGSSVGGRLLPLSIRGTLAAVQGQAVKPLPLGKVQGWVGGIGYPGSAGYKQTHSSTALLDRGTLSGPDGIQPQGGGGELGPTAHGAPSPTCSTISPTSPLLPGPRLLFLLLGPASASLPVFPAASCLPPVPHPRPAPCSFLLESQPLGGQRDCPDSRDGGSLVLVLPTCQMGAENVLLTLKMRQEGSLRLRGDRKVDSLLAGAGSRCPGSSLVTRCCPPLGLPGLLLLGKSHAKQERAVIPISGQGHGMPQHF